MKKYSVVLLCTTMAATLMVTACSPKTSAERHARQYVYAADDGVNPNFYVKKADSIRMMVPFFRQFHNEGVKDRVAGMSREEAQHRAGQFRREEFISDPSDCGTTVFLCPKSNVYVTGAKC